MVLGVTMINLKEVNMEKVALVGCGAYMNNGYGV
jgi:hypothetical protein